MEKKILHIAGLIAGTAAVAIVLVGCSGSGSGSGSDTPGEGYPAERIRFIVPYSAGGPTDVTARALGPCLTGELGQTVVVENLAGGSGALGLQELISSDPDGYTVVIGSPGMVVLTPLVNGLDYSMDDITPVGIISQGPMNLVVGENSPYKDAEAFIQAAKDNPGTLNVGVSGAATPQAFELQRLEDEYGIDITVVPFDGDAGVTTALLGGHADAAFRQDSPEVAGRIEDGSFRALAVSSAERQAHLPDVPTLVELGFPDLTLAVTTYILAGPADMPDGIVTTLADGLETCLQDSQVVAAIGERFVPTEFGDSALATGILAEAASVWGEILKK